MAPGMKKKAHTIGHNGNVAANPLTNPLFGDGLYGPFLVELGMVYNWVNYHIYQPDISQLSSHYGWLMVVIYI
jgi:hypothetical protein